MAKIYDNTKIRLTNGEDIVLKDFFHENYPVFSSFASKYIANTDLCEDIVQDIFIKFWESKQTFLCINTVKAYFYKSIRNSCLDHIKHEKVKDKYVEYKKFRNDSIQFFWDEIIRKEAYSIVYSEMNKLPEMAKKVLLLALNDKSNEEIAEEVGISTSTVKNHKYRAYKILRKKLGRLVLLFMSLKYRGMRYLN